jgi:nitrate/nitrite transport system ATP-binding protein
MSGDPMSNVLSLGRKRSDPPANRTDASMPGRRLISIEGIAKRYPRKGEGELTIFEDLWLPIDRGEFVCIIGHSGCGKTTVLNILAGLDEPSDGVVIVDGREIAGPSLDRAVIFQGHALLPWMSVLGNVAYAVSARHPDWSKGKVREHAQRFIELVGLGHAASRKPAELSGGMKQRVGIARALSLEPKTLLMDEPFSALDALTRGTLQDEVRRICVSSDQTVLMITHDVDEAIYLADKIVLMTNGPGAHVAEIVRNMLPRERERADLHRLPGYYELRNHLMDFLVTRSSTFRDELARGRPWNSKAPPVVEPINDAVPAALAAETGSGDHAAL